MSLCRAALAPPGVEQRRGAERGWRARRAGPLTPLEARGRIGFGPCGRLGQKWPPVLGGPPGGARLCGGLAVTAPPQYLPVRRWVSECVCACRRPDSDAIEYVCTRVPEHIQFCVCVAL